MENLVPKHYKQIITNLGIKNSNKYSTKRIINSTPKRKSIPKFKINLLLSPIKLSIEKKDPCSSTTLFYKDSDLNTQNTTENIINDGIQILSKIIEQQGCLNTHNTLQQTFYDIDVLNMDDMRTNYSNDSQSQINFISRDPKYIQAENYISQIDKCNLSMNIKTSEWEENKRKTLFSK